jgi:hypothetical protein
MSKISVKNIHKPTPAKWSKFGLACVASSAFISASAFASQHEIIGYIGLGIGFVGTFISTLFAE